MFLMIHENVMRPGVDPVCGKRDVVVSADKSTYIRSWADNYLKRVIFIAKRSCLDAGRQCCVRDE